MAVPLMRAYTYTAGVLDVFTLATDDITGLSVQQLNRDNVILDFVSMVQPATAETYEIRTLVNGLESGVTFFSVSSDPASSGRVVPGPIPITIGGAAGGKQLAYNSAQTTTGGGIVNYSFLIKYANLF
jgi:hypothetical protein